MIHHRIAGTAVVLAGLLCAPSAGHAQSRPGQMYNCWGCVSGWNGPRCASGQVTGGTSCREWLTYGGGWDCAVDGACGTLGVAAEELALPEGGMVIAIQISDGRYVAAGCFGEEPSVFVRTTDGVIRRASEPSEGEGASQQ